MNRRKFIKAACVTGFSISLISKTVVVFGDERQDLYPILIDEKGRPITTLTKWNKQRKIILKRWSDYLGILKSNPDPPLLKVINEDRPEGLIRQHVEYESEPGIAVQGYLIKPEVTLKPVPGIVAMHSTSDKGMIYIAGVEKGEIVAFGYKLAQQGYVVFCPMCFLWHNKGDRTYEQQVQLFNERHPGSKGMAKMLFDTMRAVDVLVSLKEVDATRIGAMGHSLGAKEALYLGAFDDRVKVVVSNEGGIGIDFSNWDAVWYLGEGIHEFGHKHHEVLSLIAPKPFLLIGGDSSDGEISRPFIEAVLPVYDLYGDNMRKNIQLKNHGTGHNVAPIAEKWTYDWLNEFLMQGY
jgi:hypothetical protein